MSYAKQQSDPHGASSQENTPQIVVRAGKHYICSVCGTLVEIPADVVGQLVIAVDPAPQDLSDSPPADQPKPVPQQPTGDEDSSKSPPATSNKRTMPPRPSRPKQPRRKSFNGQMIDGLRVPSAEELDRAFAWVTFHLTVLDRQGTEVKRLQKLLRKQRKKQPLAAQVCALPIDTPNDAPNNTNAPTTFPCAEQPREKGRAPP